MTKRSCGCTNHMGTLKAAHRTRDAALEEAMDLLEYTGVVRIYECPHSDRYHVTTRPLRK